MLPQRIILAIMAFLGVAVYFTMRVCISIALTEMVKPIETKTETNDTAVCSAVTMSMKNTTIHSNSVHETDTKYSWSQEEQGWILSSFYGGYLIGHIPGAILPQKYSAKWLFSLSVLIPSVFNAALPLALTYGMYDVYVNRIVSLKRYKLVSFSRKSRCIDVDASFDGNFFRFAISSCYYATGRMDSNKRKNNTWNTCARWRSSKCFLSKKLTRLFETILTTCKDDICNVK